MGGTASPPFHRFLLVRDDFYPDPDAVRAIAQGMSYREYPGAVGHMSHSAYLPRGIRRRLERILGIAITRWDGADEGNGIFYKAFSRGGQKEIPGVHYDEPADDITVVVYLTPGLPPECGTSLWQHRPTGLINAPRRADAVRLGTTLRKLRERLDRESERRDRWVEIDRAGYRYNRMVAYASGMLHSASRHFGSNLRDGRIYQTFRIGVDWSTCRIHA
jgi:Family of unknown function (DUF6445)